MTASLRTVLAIAFILAVPAAYAETFTVKGTAGSTFQATSIAKFKEPWAMTFLPAIDGKAASMLVTTKPGKMFHVEADGTKHRIKGLPKVAYGGQGGLGDVILHPEFASNRLIYFSYAKKHDGDRGAVVARAKLKLKKSGGGKITAFQVIWKQKPKVSGKGHYSHRLVFGPKGSKHEGKLFITSGDRQKRTPAQDMNVALGKIIRVNDDGSIPDDNPFLGIGKKARTFWSIGHRNMLGIAFDGEGRLWATEMGPRHGDELNLIIEGANYGWPVVSEGKHYSGISIPKHETRTEFKAPKAHWVPSIAPAGLVIYSGKTFPDWQGNAFIGGLVSRALIRVELEGERAREVERFKWKKRIREVEQGPDGSIWVLEDRSGGRLLRLEP